MSDMTLTKVLRTTGLAKLTTVHGLRSSFVTTPVNRRMRPMPSWNCRWHTRLVRELSGPMRAVIYWPSGGGSWNSGLHTLPTITQTWCSYMGKRTSDLPEAIMEVILKDTRDYKKELSDALDNVDSEAIVRDYLPIFDEMKILAYWENKPMALFENVNQRRCLQGDSSMATAMMLALRLEHEFSDLVKRSKYDIKVFNALRNLSAKHYQYLMLLPYIPLALREWIVEYLAGRLKPPTLGGKRLRFLRNIKIVKLLNFLSSRGIPPTRNTATGPGQYGIDIVRKMVHKSRHTIATIWKDRYKYWDGPYVNWESFRRVFDPDISDTSKKAKNRHEDISDRNEKSTPYGYFIEKTPEGIRTRVIPWVNLPI